MEFMASDWCLSLMQAATCGRTCGRSEGEKEGSARQADTVELEVARTVECAGIAKG